MQVKDLKWHLILRICLKFPKYKKGRRREERTKLTNLSKCVTPAPHAATKADLSPAFPGSWAIAFCFFPEIALLKNPILFRSLVLPLF